MIRFAAVALTRWATGQARALLAQLRGAGETGRDEDAEAHDDVEVLQPLGLRVRPVQRGSLEAVVVERGDERVALFLVDKVRVAGAVEAEEGETQLHGLAEQSAVFRIRASGAIEITPKAGQDLVLHGGTLKAARVTDPVSAHANMTAWMTAVSGYINGLAPGTITPALPVNFAAVSAGGGASNVKA